MNKIIDAFNVRSRYLRSAHIERDFHDPSALSGYVVTRDIQECLDRIAQGLDNKSRQRAWRVTGNYGSGKSSFALLLAHAFSGFDTELPSQLRRSINLQSVRRHRPQLLPVLVTGSREPLGKALIRALYRALESKSDKRSPLECLALMAPIVGRANADVSDAQVLELIAKSNDELVSRKRATGLLIILDEMGKFLEFAALHPEKQDIFLLQQLAELSSAQRSHPLFLVGLLHQGFSAYSDQLTQSSQLEWEKIAGRFQEIIFDQPLDQVAHLIGHALDLKRHLIPRGWESRSKTAMRAAIEHNWFGSSAPITSLVEAATSIYPLHPTVVPVLARLFGRFGQNERSLFSFLLSNEAYGLQSFSALALTVENVYRIHNLYDYAASNFGHKLTVQSYRNHWNHIDSLIKSFPSKHDLEVQILKTVGLLNLLNSPEMIPSEEAIIAAVSDGTYEGQDRAKETLAHLHHSKKVLYHRGLRGGYSLWSHTSINLDSAYDDAVRAVASHRKVADQIKGRLDNRPVVARRHYIQTGNLRHFEVKYCSAAELPVVANHSLDHADGRIIIPLCENAEERIAAELFAKQFKQSPTTLVGLTEPLGSLAALIQEVERWAFVEKATPELKDDRYAQEEVSRQLANATITLEKRVQHYVGLREAALSSGGMSIRWYSAGKEMTVASSSGFLSLLSDICDSVYAKAPKISNELINRRSLSSAAAAARMRLIQRMIESSEMQYLGMDSAKAPPEMSMYLSVLLETGLHRKSGENWVIGEPTRDLCNLLPALRKVKSLLEDKVDARVSVEEIFSALRKAPYGVREGLLPLLLIVVVLEWRQHVAAYENGTFKSQLTAADVLRLTKDPAQFELQLCRVQGVRLTVFQKLFEVLNLKVASASRSEILDIVRPLCVFAAELPQFTKTTKNLSPTTLAVREMISEAREPGPLLFNDLPRACGFEPFLEDEETSQQSKKIKLFVTRLQESLEELKFAMPSLRNRIATAVCRAFEHTKDLSRFQSFRDSLAKRAEDLMIKVSDLEMKAFCFRLMENTMPEAEWIESLGSLIASTPPSRWKDDDEKVFEERLKAAVMKFRRVESVNFSGLDGTKSKSAVRISITQRDGSEIEDVVYLSPSEEEDAMTLESKLKALETKNPRVMLAALSKFAWQLLKETK